jgi:hypothetical protein
VDGFRSIAYSRQAELIRDRDLETAEAVSGRGDRVGHLSPRHRRMDDEEDQGDWRAAAAQRLRTGASMVNLITAENQTRIVAPTRIVTVLTNWH